MRFVGFALVLIVVVFATIGFPFWLIGMDQQSKYENDEIGFSGLRPNGSGLVIDVIELKKDDHIRYYAIVTDDGEPPTVYNVHWMAETTSLLAIGTRVDLARSTIGRGRFQTTFYEASPATSR